MFHLFVSVNPASFSYKDDEIESPFDLILVKPKKLTHTASDSISVGRRSDLPLHDNAQPMKLLFILQRKKDEIGGGESLS